MNSQKNQNESQEMKQNMCIKITDVCFINSLKQLKGSIYLRILLHLIQFIAMIVMIPIDLLVDPSDSSNEILPFFIVATCVTFINMGIKFIHLKFYLFDANLMQNIAQQINHVIDISQQPNHPTQNYADIQFSSKIYNCQNNLTVQQVDDAMRKIVQPQNINMIKILATSKDPCYKCFGSLGGMFSFGLFIYGIVLLATVPSIETAELVVIIIFCVSEFLIQLKLFLCLILVALIPLICILVCIYACFCSNKDKPAQLPQSVHATIDIIQKADAAPCSICFQNIMVQQSVIILPCSQKHVFHQNCIKGWTNLKSTCPICRYDLS